MSLPRILLLITLATGCASAPHEAYSARDVTRAPLGAIVASGTLTAGETNAHDDTPLRHFYLLSPGPDAKLVVTQSDVSRH